MNPDSLPLYVTGMSVVMLALTARSARRIPDTATYGLLALSQVIMCIGGFITQSTVGGSISGAAAGYLGWKWWDGGGGDGTRRRLRRWARRFHGVRRTAPAGSE